MKLTKYKSVAIVKTEHYSDFPIAIYDDGFNYNIGDEVLISGNSDNIKKIINIITPEESAQKFDYICSEVICPVDVSKYNKRMKKRCQANAIKDEMDNIIENMPDEERYRAYTVNNKKLSRLYDEYFSLLT